MAYLCYNIINNGKGTQMSTTLLIESYARTHPGLTDREIATALGLGH